MRRKRKQISTCVLEGELAILYQISSLIQSSPSNRETFQAILKLIGKAIDFRAASLYLMSPETGQLVEVATMGRSVDLIGFVRFRLGTGISAWVAQEKRPILLNNLRKSVGGSHMRSFLSVPMLFRDEVIGVINLAHDQPEAFRQSDLQLMSIIATEVALTIERAIYEHSLAGKETELQQLKQRLKENQARLLELEKKSAAGEQIANLDQEISNALAIVLGNAQFLLMTMKDSHPSILKRLRAIDHEASAIAQVLEKLRKSDEPAGKPKAAGTFVPG